METKEKSNRFEDNRYVFVDNKKSKRGYTTGSCAAAAAKAAATMLFKREKVDKIELMTPKGLLLNLDVLEIDLKDNYVSCAIRKDGGDDPDATHGILIFAKVSLTDEKGIEVTGGEGVGTVTKPGLQCDIGMSAINNTPMRMIKEAVTKVSEDNNYEGGIKVVISVPEGEEIAKRTFNPRLGIIGGISILGTSGIVEPMSEKALIDTTRVEMGQYLADGHDYMLITPGNYGQTFSEEQLNLDVSKSVKCSNFVGETVDMAVQLGVKGILFISHIGKFVKVAGGIMNTHSKNSDSRMEILTANALLAGADTRVLKEVMNSVTTDDALKILNENNLMEATMKNVTDKIEFYLNNRAKGSNLEIAVIVFSNVFGVLGETDNAKQMIKKINKKGN
ncbi:MAG: cobalt-precorrin-5B (C(1))-methyltransferase CbiD [Clostridium sp.]|nr:cobalt-precorrin-5B (C(1))-methyltransferase CbiD [Clostridium sp.]